jgi:hypothetical protein
MEGDDGIKQRGKERLTRPRPGGKGGGGKGEDVERGRSKEEEQEKGTITTTETKTKATQALAEHAKLKAKLLVAERQVLVLQGKPLAPPPYREYDTVEEAVTALATEMGLLQALKDAENADLGVGGRTAPTKQNKPNTPICQFFKPEVVEPFGNDLSNPYFGLQQSGEEGRWDVRYVQPPEAALFPYPNPHDNHKNGTQNEVGRPYFVDHDEKATQWIHPTRPDSWSWPPPPAAQNEKSATAGGSQDGLFDSTHFATSVVPDAAAAAVAAEMAGGDIAHVVLEEDPLARMDAWALVQGGGIIEIVVYEAKGLKQVQNGGRAMSPYVKLQVAGCVVPCRTRFAKNGGEAPVWCPLPQAKYRPGGAGAASIYAAEPDTAGDAQEAGAGGVGLVVPVPPSSSSSSRAPGGGRKVRRSNPSVPLPEGRMPAPLHYGRADCAITFELRQETLFPMPEPPLLLLEVWNKSFHTKDNFVGHTATAWVEAAVSQQVQVVNLTDLQGKPAGQVAIGIQFHPTEQCARKAHETTLKLQMQRGDRFQLACAKDKSTRERVPHHFHYPGNTSKGHRGNPVQRAAPFAYSGHNNFRSCKVLSWS